MFLGIYKKIFVIFKDTLSKHGFLFSYRLPSNIHPSIVFSNSKGITIQIGYDYENHCPYGRIYGNKLDFPEYEGDLTEHITKQLHEYKRVIDSYLSSKSTELGQVIPSPSPKCVSN